MRNPYIPLVIRLVVLTFSAAALGISGRIFHLTNRSDCDAGSSTYMAIIVDVIAIVYLCYITYDEYTAQPLGLRNPKSKLRLIFLDLLFIVFDSANLSIVRQSRIHVKHNTVNNDVGFSILNRLKLGVCGQHRARRPGSPDMLPIQRVRPAEILNGRFITSVSGMAANFCYQYAPDCGASCALMTADPCSFACLYLFNRFVIPRNATYLSLFPFFLLIIVFGPILVRMRC